MSTLRPRTSNPRGFCKYYTTDRGCYSGSQCKFLHSHPSGENKLCFYYAAGYCKRGESCWFRHVQESSSISPLSTTETQEPEPEPCSICLETPITYGLLVNCSHVFCIQCVRQWRAAKHDVSWSGANKACPLCRVASPAVIPSSHFYPISKEGVPSPRESIISNYRASCKRIQCKYFEDSKKKGPGLLWCPFGRDCFYKHEKDDGSLHHFEQSVVGRRGLLPRPGRSRSSGSFGRDYSNTIALLSQLIHAPLNLLREAVAVAPLGLPAVLSMLAIDFLPTPPANDEDLLDGLGIAEAIHFSTSTHGNSDSIMDEMRMRMELIYRLGQRLSGEGDDADNDDSDDDGDDPIESLFGMPGLEPVLNPSAPEDDPPPPPPSLSIPEYGDGDDDNNEPPALLEVPDSEDEEEASDGEEDYDEDDDDPWLDDDDDVEINMPPILEFSPVSYHLWTQRSHPSRPVLRRRRSDSPPPLEPIEIRSMSSYSSLPPLATSERLGVESGGEGDEEEAIFTIPIFEESPPPPPPPGPYTTDGRGRPVFWNTDSSNTTDLGPSGFNQKS